jgi:hypothetical protein
MARNDSVAVEHLAFAAAKASSKPDFVSYFLSIYLELEDVTEEDLRKHLGCDRLGFYKLSLMRAPDLDSDGFGAGVRRLAEAVGISAFALATILRRVQAANRLGAAGATERQGLLAAARDHEPTEMPQPRGTKAAD